MMNDNQANISPPGPQEKMDIHISEESFPEIEDLLGRYPDVCRVHAQSRKNDSFLLNSPDYIKRVLIDNHKNYLKGVGFERVKLLLGNGIIVSDGDFWKQQRRMVQTAFHREMLKELTGMMHALSEQLKADWILKARQQTEINLSQAMSTFALEVVLRSIFGEDLDWLTAQSGGNPFIIFSEDTGRDLNLAVKFRALIKLMLSVVERRRRENLLRPDMLGALMQARDLQGQPMTDKALIDEVMTLIVAGHETSATTLTWMWYRLSQHAEVQQQLHQEVDALGFGSHCVPDIEQASKLVYCKQVMFECLRLYPPVWLFSRKALADDRVGDYMMPAGADIFISPYFLHRRPDIWQNPEQFDPNRFTKENIAQQHRVAFIPFSAGPRKCIGDMFSIVEIQIHMGTIARELMLTAVAGQSIELEPAINLRSKHPIKMIPQMRKQ